MVNTDCQKKARNKKRKQWNNKKWKIIIKQIQAVTVTKKKQ